jgi:hypothetical protein
MFFNYAYFLEEMLDLSIFFGSQIQYEIANYLWFSMRFKFCSGSRFLAISTLCPLQYFFQRLNKNCPLLSIFLISFNVLCSYTVYLTYLMYSTVSKYDLLLQGISRYLSPLFLIFQNCNFSQRSGDIIAYATRMLQFSSEMQQTWHNYRSRAQHFRNGNKI